MFSRPLSDALAGLEQGLVAEVDTRVGSTDADGTHQVLERLRFVADTYALNIDAEREQGLAPAIQDFVINRLGIARPVE